MNWRRIDSLDGLRAVAVLLVVLRHLRLDWLYFGGTVGVTIFFVLSGFLITGLILAEHAETGRVSLPRFWLRRAFRLLPALIVFLAAMNAVQAWSGVDPFWPKAQTALFYYANIAYARGTDLTPIGHTWSLSVEEQFYVVWPLVLLTLLAVRRSAVLPAALILAVGSAAWRIAEWHTGQYGSAYFGTRSNGFALLLGCALAVAVARGWRPQVSTWTVPTMLLGLVLLTVQPGYGRVRIDWQQYLVAFPAAVLTAALIVVLSQRDWAPLAWGPLATFGRRYSYGLYLWHGGILFSMQASSAAVRVFVGVPLAFAATWLSWRLVERPALVHAARFRQHSGAEAVGGPLASRRRPRAALAIVNSAYRRAWSSVKS